MGVDRKWVVMESHKTPVDLMGSSEVETALQSLLTWGQGLGFYALTVTGFGLAQEGDTSLDKRLSLGETVSKDG